MLVVILILYFWSMDSGSAVYAVVRMVLQLLAIGYVLNYLFETEKALLIVLVLLIMLFAASWIAIAPSEGKNIDGLS